MLAVDTTSVALGSIFAEIADEDIDKLVSWLNQMAIIVESGVQSVGPPANYALVWEWGNIRQTKKGPKTVQGRNPKGQFTNRWFSTQAPSGWIAINEDKYWNIIQDELSKVSFDSKESITEDSLKQELTGAYKRISEKCLVILQENVPIDSGDLYDSLQVVEPGDEILKGVNDLASDMINTIGTLNL